ncbi:MAG: methyltransferase domain-containing protein, partial [Alphaproteobacteria bacterium]|nr:methyltransferase domain-containing protein [Alphaproteobacteria bacterium]
MTPKTQSKPSLELKALLVLFFFSGFPALLYQIVWQRALFRIFGVNIESVTITVTAFMLGLGLGSLAGGLLSRVQRFSPLLLLAAIEILTGIFGHFSMDIFQAAGEHVLGMPLAVTASVTLALVLIPTLLMGATLPLLVSYAVRLSSSVGSSVGQLYYVNTLGAGAVCLLASVTIFPFLQSMQMAVDIAVAMNAAVALGALAAFFFIGKRTRKDAPPAASKKNQKPLLGLGAVLALAFFSGFVSLSYELFFFRTVSYSSGSISTDFTFTLAAYLIGLASGARLSAESCAKGAQDVLKDTLRSLFIATAIGFAFLPILGLADRINLGDRYADTAVAVALIYLIARGWGRLLPGLAHLGIAPDERAGLHTAWLYLSNICGSVLGSVLTGFVLMDVWGLVDLSQALVAGGFLCAAFLAAAAPLPNKRLYIGGAALMGVLGYALLPAATPRILEKLLWKGGPEAAWPFEQVVENRGGILAVDRHSAVYGNGIYDGMFNTSILDDTNGILRPYALSYYNASPREVLEIGLASGSWAQILANVPGVEHLTIVEINPGYLDFIENRPEVSSLLSNPKVSIIIDDGRRWLRLHPEKKFDAIVSNTTYNFRSNATNLLSVEFLELVKKHLNPGGTFFYNTTDSARVQRT